MGSIIEAKYQHKADVLHSVPVNPVTGEPEFVQDPETGEIIPAWDDVADVDTDNVDEPTTIFCATVAGIPGSRQGSGEEWGEEFLETDAVTLVTRAHVTRADKVTNIRTRKGQQLWLNANGTPIVFDVRGVQPRVEPLGGLAEYVCVLVRSD